MFNICKLLSRDLWKFNIDSIDVLLMGVIMTREHFKIRFP